MIMLVLGFTTIYILLFTSLFNRLPKHTIEKSVRKSENYDLRIIVIVFNRAKSMLRLLNTINEADYSNDSVKLEVHIDRNYDNQADLKTVEAAKNFVFKHGDYEVIVKNQHIGITGQWLTPWLPDPASKEIAVILEDDMTLSKYFYRYLKLVHLKYDNRTDINGYALQGKSKTHNLTRRGLLEGPRESLVFLYPVLGTWGFSPNNRNWRAFLDWYDNRKNTKSPRKFRIPGNIASRWYKMLYKHGRGETMWEIWHIYFAYKHHEYTLYSNFPGHLGLSANWAEKGLHSKGIGKASNQLLNDWKPEYEDLPDNPPVVDLSAKVVGL